MNWWIAIIICGVLIGTVILVIEHFTVTKPARTLAEAKLAGSSRNEFISKSIIAERPMLRELIASNVVERVAFEYVGFRGGYVFTVYYRNTVELQFTLTCGVTTPEEYIIPAILEVLTDAALLTYTIEAQEKGK